MTIRGWKIIYTDGTVLTSRGPNWDRIRGDGVLIVSIYFRETYRRYNVDLVWVTENYKKEFLGEDYYWMNADGSIDAGSAADVPFTDLSEASVKTGTLVRDDVWLQRYNSFHEDRIW